MRREGKEPVESVIDLRKESGSKRGDVERGYVGRGSEVEHVICIRYEAEITYIQEA